MLKSNNVFLRRWMGGASLNDRQTEAIHRYFLTLLKAVKKQPATIIFNSRQYIRLFWVILDVIFAPHASHKER